MSCGRSIATTASLSANGRTRGWRCIPSTFLLPLPTPLTFATVVCRRIRSRLRHLQVRRMSALSGPMLCISTLVFNAVTPTYRGVLLYHHIHFHSCCTHRMKQGYSSTETKLAPRAHLGYCVHQYTIIKLVNQRSDRHISEGRRLTTKSITTTESSQTYCTHNLIKMTFFFVTIGLSAGLRRQNKDVVRNHSLWRISHRHLFNLCMQREGTLVEALCVTTFEVRRAADRRIRVTLYSS
jgi:hypothetical protein